MIRIVIADDHALIREGVKKILRRQPDLKIIGDAGNGSELLGILRDAEPDLLILDISLPGRSGIDLLGDIRKLRPALRVLVLSMHEEERFAVRVLKSGAAGYVCKSTAAEELVAAIRKVVAGGRYVSPAVAEILAGQLNDPAGQAAHEQLTNRELQILTMIGAGKAVKQIASELGISINTVATHRARILKKMDLQSSAALVRYAVEHSLV
jgi:two-component system invasion response regulator UvrY